MLQISFNHERLSSSFWQDTHDKDDDDNDNEIM